MINYDALGWTFITVEIILLIINASQDNLKDDIYNRIVMSLTFLMGIGSLAPGIYFVLA